jgi:methylamine dehydrogenase heavy chain
VLEVWDAQTLAFKHEVLLPPRRAQTLNYRGLVSVSANGRFVWVQNATPASSITVVDLAEKKVATEIQTPGCWGTLPAAAHPARFGMLCSDGRITTVTLDEQGQEAGRQLSDVLFDPDRDAWFHSAERIGDRYFFLSFQGRITEVDLSGTSARQVAQPWASSAPSRPGSAGGPAATRPLPCTPAAAGRWWRCTTRAAKARTSCRPSSCGPSTWPAAAAWPPRPARARRR